MALANAAATLSLELFCSVEGAGDADWLSELFFAASRASLARRCLASRSSFSRSRRSFRASKRCFAFSALFFSSRCNRISDLAWR